MYPHQKEGFEFICQNLTGTIDLSELKNSDLSGGGGSIISHAPGTGKTRLTIVFLETFLKLFPNARPVIVAPVSILLTWEEEFRKWKVKVPFLNLNNLVSSGHENHKDLLRVSRMKVWKKGGSVLGVSYSLLEKLAGEKFHKQKGKTKKGEKVVVDKNREMMSISLEMPGLVVLDEGHTARNKKSSIWNALSNTTAAPFMHFYKGTNILQNSLPGLKDFVVLLNPPPLQRNLIEALENLEKQKTFEYEHKMALVSVHPSLVLQCKNLTEKEKFAFNQEKLEKLSVDYDQGVKTRFVMELVRLSNALGEKVLVFSQYVLPLELIKDHLKADFHWFDGKEVLHMGGKIEQKHRQKMINIFNDPKSEAKVMLASIKCCSEGIHLLGASRIVLLDVAWNPSVERQAICRAYRLGQKKVVYTYHLMTSGTTEGEKYCRQAQKDRISELVFSAPSSSTNMEGTEKQKDPVEEMDDKIQEDMVEQIRLKDMFKKIIYQPKEKNLIESFGTEFLSMET